jgi:hypothetical protein
MEARKRSPLAWLDNAADALPVDIGTGIHDGHTGSVPVSQAVNAFNLLAEPQDRISDEDIAYIVEKEAIPAHLQGTFDDPVFGTHTIHFRRQSKKARLTLFEGGHDILCDAAFSWLSKQCKGKTPDWSPGEAVEGGAQLSAIAK